MDLLIFFKHISFVFFVSVCASGRCENDCRYSPARLGQSYLDMFYTPAGTEACRHEDDAGSALGGVLRLLRRKILTALDRALDSHTLRVTDGVYLVNESPQEQRLESGATDSEPFLVALVRRLARLLETRALRIRLGVMKYATEQVRGFHRGYRHAFPMMVGSFMLLAAFTVPMGFQFLAVVGGKALVLSQIALFLALGGHLQRYMGWGGTPAAPGGGFVQHEYFLRDDLRPWHREGSDPGVAPQHQQPGHLSNQQLQGYMSQPLPA